jgi:transglutaminase-like putative cysteine protease
MRRIITPTILFLLSALACVAAPDALLDRDAVLRAAAEVTAERYPNADDALVDNAIRSRYEPDGRAVTFDDEYIKVLTEKGRREAMTRSVHFTLPYSTAVVHRAEIIRPDGTVRSVDLASQSRVMVDPGQMSANIYNPNALIRQVSLPDVEIGDLVHFFIEYRLLKPRVPNTWSDYSVLEYTSPIRRLTLEVDAPRALPLATIALKDEVEGTVEYALERRGERDLHRWVARDVPRMYREPNMPPLHTVVQRLLVSTIPDWPAISRWYWTLSKPRLDAITPDMEDKVRELTEGADGDDQIIERLFRFVAQQVRYMGITTEEEAPGYEPHDVCVTFRNRYGVCRDKAALLVSMLRLAGLDAFPVLIHTGPKKDEDVPQPFFNHAITAVLRDDGSYTLMDPTDENTRVLRPSYLDNKSYLVARPDGDELRTSPVSPAEDNLVRIRTAARLARGGGLKAESTLHFEGVNDGVYRNFLARRKPEERRRFFESRLESALPGAEITAFRLEPDDLRDLDAPLRAILSFEAASWIPERGDRALLPFIRLGDGLGVVNFILGGTGLDERTYPLFTEIPCGVDETFTVLDEADIIRDTRWPAPATHDIGTALFEQSFEGGDGGWTARSRFALTAVEFDPAQYRALKQWRKDVEVERRRRPVARIDRGVSREPDIAIREECTEIEWTAPGAWTVHREQTMEVLTYAGKKRFAEIRLSFNPAWESVELVGADIVGPDGERHAVVEEEMNLMDAAWSGGAPRYPAAKTLVINLPGVQVGSVITTRIRRTQWDRPFFSLAEVFAGDEPAERRKLIVRAAAGLDPAIRESLHGLVDASRAERADGSIEYRWEAVKVEARERELMTPPAWSFLPSVLLSAGNWTSYAAAIRDQLSRAAAGQTATSAKARELTEGLASDLERVRAIRDFVAVKIRAAGPPLPDLPLEAITPADRTLADGYGNDADRAVLLAAMLREVGFEPEWLLAASNGSALPELLEPMIEAPQRPYFGTVLVRVRADGQSIVLNDTDQYAPLGSTPHDGKPALAMDGSIELLAAPEGRRDRTETVYDIVLDSDGSAVLSRTRAFRGMDMAAMHKLYAEMPPEEQRRHTQELIASVSQSAELMGELRTAFGGDVGSESFRVRIPRYAIRTGEFLQTRLPRTLPPLMPLPADRRAHPFHRGKSDRRRIETRFRVTDPAAEAVILPPDADWRTVPEAGRLRVKTRRAADGAWVVEQESRFAEAIIPAVRCDELADGDRLVSGLDRTAVLFRLGEADAPNRP